MKFKPGVGVGVGKPLLNFAQNFRHMLNVQMGNTMILMGCNASISMCTGGGGSHFSI